MSLYLPPQNQYWPLDIGSQNMLCVFDFVYGKGKLNAKQMHKAKQVHNTFVGVSFAAENQFNVLGCIELR